MAIAIVFLDNKSYGANELNAIGDDLMALESTTFTDGVDYGVEDLNEITANLINKGVFKSVESGCLPAVIDTNVKIQSGLVVFGNGAKARIDTDGVVLPFTAGIVNYVYLICDTTTNTVEAKCETTEPTTGDFVMIGEVSSAGVMTDKRQFAYMKNASVLPNILNSYNVNLTWTDTLGSFKEVYSIDVGVGYRFVRVISTKYSKGSYGYFIILYDFGANNHFGIWQRNTNGDMSVSKNGEITIGTNAYLKLSYDQGIIRFLVKDTSNNSGTHAISVEVI